VLAFAAVIRTIRGILLPADDYRRAHTPSFIANQMGHKHAQSVRESCATWIEKMNSERVEMLNGKLAI